jgi:predicted ATPase/DNA-binding SARP family transcriptional activator
MPALILSLLGPFQAKLGDRELDRFRTNKVQALLIYLAVEAGAAHRREALMELLWPGLPLKSAQVNLRQTLYQLRRAIPQVAASYRDDGESVPLVLSDRHTAQLNPAADVRLDVARFAQLISRTPTREPLADAIALYRGDFLCDFYLPDSAEFEDWATNKRAELRRQALDALETLIAHYNGHGEHDRAQSYAWRALEIDDLREDAHRGLMIALALSGQRTAALAQYQVCRKRLWDELGVEPSAETTALYEQIQADALRESQERQPPPPSVAGGMPVFLFTDIEGSTPLWHTHRQAMLTAQLVHNQILEEQIALHGGRILELRGDGVKAVFEGVNPLPCVLAIQQALGEQQWGPVGEIRIRIGLLGVPPESEGSEFFVKDDRYFGPAVPRAQRVMDAGHGGQILVSEQVRDAFPLPPGATWHDFGWHNLKGVEEPQRIFGLLHPDLPLKEFPPLRTLSALAEPADAAAAPEPAEGPQPAHNLPMQPTPFVGRGPELTQLNRLLADPEVRLVTVLGGGGMGKTRLAIEAGTDQLDRYPDGVYFVSLAGVEASAGILPAVAQALGFSFYQDPRPGSSVSAPRQQLLDYLRGKRTLLLLDNFEHLLLTPDMPAPEVERPTDLVSDILGTAPEVDILATSRTPLRIQREQLFHLGGMRYPSDGHEEDIRLDALVDDGGFSALQLFVSNAQRAQPSFQLTSQNLKDVVRICRLVDGTPLAIVLAAAWVTTLNLGKIAEEIERGIDLLETELRDVPPRQRSMRATFEHSWRLLSDRQRAVMAGLSVFRGGSTSEAAQAVTGASLMELRRLVQSSLVMRDETPSAGQAGGRYHLHELVRQCAAEKLADSPGAYEAARERHCAYFADALQRWGDELKGPRQGAALEGMDREIDNARAAWNWAVSQWQTERLDQALEGLYLFYTRRLRWGEGETAFRAAAEKMKTDASDVELRLLAAITARWASLLGALGRRERADQLLTESLAFLDPLDPTDRDVQGERAFVLYQMGNAPFDSDLARAKELCEQSLAAYRQLGDQYGAAIVLERLSWLAMFLGNYAAAEMSVRESLAIRRVLGDQDGIASALIGLGTLLAAILGRCEEGEEAMREGIAIYQKQGDRAGVAYGSGQLSAALLPQGKYDETCTALTEAAAIYTDLAFPMANDWWNLWIGVAEMYMGRYERARTLGEAALAAARKLDAPGTVARALHLMGCLALVEGAYAEAHAHLSESVTTYRRHGLPNELVWALPDLAVAERGMEKAPQAVQHLCEALQTGTEFGTAPQLVLALPAAALFLLDRGAIERAVDVYALAARYGAVANSRWYDDLIGKHIAAAAASLPPEVVAAAQERGRARDLEETVEALLEELQLPYRYGLYSLPEVPNNLPRQQTPFVGRKQELADLDRLISDPEVRLITIVGPGGIGKTRLALAAAERQLADRQIDEPANGHVAQFPNGVFFVPLAALSSADQIIPAIAEALGLRLGGGEGLARRPDQPALELRSLAQQLLDYLREKHLLLVLDNLEHLLASSPLVLPSQEGTGSGAAALVVDILHSAAAVLVLTTSRERLHLHEEQVYPIKGLEFPDWERPEDTAEYTAAQLFVQSARRVRPDFDLGADDLTYLARICRQLEGIPLAVELAAGWVDVLSLPGISAEIQRSLDFLETDWRDVPERHRSMRAVFDASWEHLSAVERGIFGQLCVFHGGFTRDAAQEVTGANLRTLAKLVNKSLLYFDRNRERYEMHELLRQYGATALGADPEAEASARERHSDHFCLAVQKWEAALKSAGQYAALAAMEADPENVRAGWAWAVAHERTASLDKALDGICHFFELRVRVDEGQAVCRLAIQALTPHQSALSAATLRVLSRILAWEAAFLLDWGDWHAGAELLEHSRELSKEAASAGQDIRRERAFILSLEGLYAFPDYARGRHLLEQSLELWRTLGDPWQTAKATLFFAVAADVCHDPDTAKQMYDECLALFRGVGDQIWTAIALLQLGQSARRSLAYDQAERTFNECLALSQAQGEHIVMAHAQAHLGFLALFRGHFEEAVLHLQNCSSSYRESGNRHYAPVALCNLGAAFWFSGECNQARVSIDEGSAIAAEIESPRPKAIAATYRGMLDMYGRRYEEARSQASSALIVGRRIRDTFLVGRSHGILGWVALAKGSYSEAEHSFVASLLAWQQEEDREYEAWARAGLGLAAHGLGNRIQAQQHLFEALQIVVEIRAFIPLLHLMPVIPVVLADEEKRSLKARAVELYALAETHPFVATAQLFDDIAGRHIRAVPDTLGANETEAARTRGRALDWWGAAEALLAELRELGWGEGEAT